MSARVPSFPEPRSGTLNGVLEAFKTRSKAIKHSVREWRIELISNNGCERIDMDFDCYGTQVRLAFWAGGEIWFRSCKAGAQGWAYKFAFHLSRSGHAPSAIVETFKRSLVASHDCDEAMAIWSEFHPRRDWSVG